MILQIADLLSPAELKALAGTFEKVEAFVEGKKTAGWHARARKNNLQAADSAMLRGALKKVEAALMKNPIFLAAARPRGFVKLLLSRYEEGMYYGRHVDDALMGGERTDLSFTLFLNDPGSYDGGELVVERTEGERAFKLAAGQLVLYPSTTLHRVEPVTRGVRLCVVGWVRSLIRDDGQREILFDLERSIAHLREQEAACGEALDLILKTRSNLLRRWAED
jgi:PKHD-type hydroxylase